MSDEPRSADRDDRIATIRRQIAEGAYETPARLEGAVDRLLDDLIARRRETAGFPAAGRSLGEDLN